MGGDTMENELPDTAEGMEARETAQTVPTGWLVLFFGLIAWGVYYLYMYSPWGTGWTQAGELEKVNPEVGGNVGMTILFTALPTAAALVLFLLQRKKRA
jgi:heme/copper-type cytochrome/quinol oxidase subunit 2